MPYSHATQSSLIFQIRHKLTLYCVHHVCLIDHDKYRRHVKALRFFNLQERVILISFCLACPKSCELSFLRHWQACCTGTENGKSTGTLPCSKPLLIQKQTKPSSSTYEHFGDNFRASSTFVSVRSVAAASFIRVRMECITSFKVNPVSLTSCSRSSS
jgi:hypothetical protein